MDQKTALDILKMGYNVFLTGPAGSGKTFVLNEYISYLKKNKITPAITASTGIAATHINGITIHAWSAMGIREQLDQKDLKKISRNLRFRNRMRKARVLVIDEISMLHAHQLDMVDVICRHFKNESLPFGGLQLVLCGDFFQLPPVQKDHNKNVSFAFESHAWEQADMKICYLDEQHRQNDEHMINILNGIRKSDMDDYMLEMLAARIDAPVNRDKKPTRLYTHNCDVDRINMAELEKIEQKATAYQMHAEGNEKLIASLKSGCLAVESLKLKIGAQVMFVKNNFDAGYVNGTTGIVSGFDSEYKMPIVKTYSGKTITVNPEEWLFEENDAIIARIRQVPLRLAWAITVHKSQGMSLDSVEIDLARAFEFGMGYVALSRARTLEGVRLFGINDMALLVNPVIGKFDERLVESSAEFENEIAALGFFEKRKRRNEFLGLQESDKKTEKAYVVDDIRKVFKHAYMPWTDEDDAILRKYSKEGKTVAQLAKIFKRKTGAIRSRLKKMGIDQ